MGLAAVLSPAFREHPRWSKLHRVGVVLCGGNIDFEAAGFWQALTREPLAA